MSDGSNRCGSQPRGFSAHVASISTQEAPSCPHQLPSRHPIFADPNIHCHPWPVAQRYFLMKPQPPSRVSPRVYTASEATRVQGHFEGHAGGVKLCGVTQGWNSVSPSLDGLAWAADSACQCPEVARMQRGSWKAGRGGRTLVSDSCRTLLTQTKKVHNSPVLPLPARLSTHRLCVLKQWFATCSVNQKHPGPF